MKIGDIVKNKSDNMFGLVVGFKTWNWPKIAAKAHKTGRNNPVKKVIVLSELKVKEWILNHTEAIK